MTSYSSVMADYLGSDIAANRPVAPSIAPLGLGVYAASDTGAVSYWYGGSWHASPSGSVSSIVVLAPLNGGTITNTGSIGLNIGAGLTVTSNTLVATGGGGTVTQIVSGAGLHAGTITASGTLLADWNGGTVAALGTGLAISSTTLTPQWQAGSVTAIGSGITVTGGTLSAPGGGTITVVGGASTLTASSIPLGGAIPINQPGTATFTTWINQNSCTITDFTGGPTTLASTNAQAGDSLTARTVNVPAGSWTLTAHVAAQGINSGTSLCGICLTDGTKFYVMTPGNATGTPTQIVYHYTGNTFTGTDANPQVFGGNPVWYKITWNSGTTTLTFSYSYDGFNFVRIFSTSTPFLTPSQAGLLINPHGNAAGQIFAVSCNYWDIH